MTIQLALIGCGGIAKRHVNVIRDLHERGRGDFAISAVCDANEDNAREIAALIQAQLGNQPTVYADYRELIERETLDGVDILLPHGLHHSAAIDCMEAGLHVLCEKPMGVSIAACRLMEAAAERTGRILSIAVPYRRTPGQRTVHWVLNQSGLLGTPLTFAHRYARAQGLLTTKQGPLPPRMVWRRNKLMSGGGPVLDSGYHYCDSMYYFFGPVEKVYAELRALEEGQSLSFEDAPENAVFVTFTFKSGVVGSWSWNLAAAGETERSVVFYGSEGALRDTTENPFAIFHLFERRPGERETGELVRLDGKEYSLAELETMHEESLSEAERERLYPGGATDGFAVEIWEFVEAVRGNRERVEVDAEEGLRSLATGEAIYESALTGEVIYVDDVISGKRRAYQAPIDEHWGLAG